ncbi:DNA-3-methyladenine glycosylase I [Ruminococcaceae bacterium OttesenSCG-928-O06]|nr:DNA-3-methyladenine glycosylase I [Ruminococcaceae bacterium OttesenSCG-928-O06]
MAEAATCPWVHDEYERAYHDEEWGRPLHDDQKLFEMLVLEGMQAGLTWNLILKRRAGMRQAFAGFNPVQMATWGDEEKAALLANPAIIRNRAKVNAAVGNAAAFLQVQKEFGSFDAYIWGFVDGVPVQNSWDTGAQIPTSTPAAEAMSRDLKKRGFRFVGPTICYAFMQAAGMVNDHLTSCAHHTICRALATGQ